MYFGNVETRFSYFISWMLLLAAAAAAAAAVQQF
jgi:hypothetical protein